MYHCSSTDTISGRHLYCHTISIHSLIDSPLTRHHINSIITRPCVSTLSHYLVHRRSRGVWVWATLYQKECPSLPFMVEQINMHKFLNLVSLSGRAVSGGQMKVPVRDTCRQYVLYENDHSNASSPHQSFAHRRRVIPLTPPSLTNSAIHFQHLWVKSLRSISTTCI